MTKTEYEYVKMLNEKMPKFTGTPTEIEKKIAMFIYLELGKTKVFDEHYFFANNKEKKKIEKISKNKKNNIDSVIKDRKIVCITASNLYRKLLQDFGIQAFNTNLYAGDAHLSTVIAFSDGEKIVADVQRDFDKIQTKRKTCNWGQKYEFGEILNESIDENELFELHKACGYVNSKDDYMNNVIEKLRKKLQYLPPNEILKEIVNNKQLNNYQKDIGYIELYKYFSSTIFAIAPHYHRQGIDYFNCYITRNKGNGKSEREYCMCLYSIFNDKVDAYLYSNSEKKFIKTDLTTLATLEKQGLHLGKTPHERGVKSLRKYIDSNKAENIKKKYMDNYNKNSKCFEGLDFGD